MIKNLIVMLMISTLISSAWCCGPAVSFQQQVNININNQPAPPPAPPKTFEQAVKDALGSFDNQVNRDIVDSIRASFDIPVNVDDDQDARDLRNEKQENAVTLSDSLKDSIVNKLNQVNNEVNQFNNQVNQVANADVNTVDSFNRQSNILVQEFLNDVSNQVKVSLGANVNDIVEVFRDADGNIISNPGNGDVTNRFFETTDPNAQLNNNGQTQLPNVNQILNAIGFAQNELVVDIKNLRQSVISDINTINNINQDSNSAFTLGASDFDLDAGYEENVNVRLDIIDPVFLPGGSKSFDRANSDIFRMIEALRDRFPANSTIARDLTFFLNLFPASQEQIVQDSLTPGENIFATTGTKLKDIQNSTFSNNSPHQNFDANNNTFSTNSFVVSNSGRLIGINNDLANQRDNNGNLTQDAQNFRDNVGGRFIDTQNVSRIQIDATKDIEPLGGQIGSGDRGFNSRTFGGVNGQFDAIQITVGDRTYALYDNVFTSPIVLDLDGDGRLEASNGIHLPHGYVDGRLVEFDINGDGFVDITEWVGENDGLLIQYDSSVAVDGRQLFGDAQGFLNGYEKLRLLDTNGDNILTEGELSTLSVWQDKNLNAKVDAGEITSLVDMGVTELGVDHNNFVSHFVRNGDTLKTWDWYPCTFRVKKKK